MFYKESQLLHFLKKNLFKLQNLTPVLCFCIIQPWNNNQSDKGLLTKTCYSIKLIVNDDKMGLIIKDFWIILIKRSEAEEVPW